MRNLLVVTAMIFSTLTFAEPSASEQIDQVVKMIKELTHGVDLQIKTPEQKAKEAEIKELLKDVSKFKVIEVDIEALAAAVQNALRQQEEVPESGSESESQSAGSDSQASSR